MAGALSGVSSITKCATSRPTFRKPWGVPAGTMSSSPAPSARRCRHKPEPERSRDAFEPLELASVNVNRRISTWLHEQLGRDAAARPPSESEPSVTVNSHPMPHSGVSPGRSTARMTYLAFHNLSRHVTLRPLPFPSCLTYTDKRGSGMRQPRDLIAAAGDDIASEPVRKISLAAPMRGSCSGTELRYAGCRNGREE
jgi:hypothetical protein